MEPIGLRIRVVARFRRICLEVSKKCIGKLTGDYLRFRLVSGMLQVLFVNMQTVMLEGFQWPNIWLFLAVPVAILIFLWAVLHGHAR